MQVVIPLSSLQKHGACRAYLDSPDWDKERQALVYEDWHQTVLRLMSDQGRGVSYLDWLVSHRLVPMTPQEFIQLRNERGHRRHPGQLRRAASSQQAQKKREPDPFFSLRLSMGRAHG